MPLVIDSYALQPLSQAVASEVTARTIRDRRTTPSPSSAILLAAGIQGSADTAEDPTPGTTDIF
jgi:hypothetical protein